MSIIHNVTYLVLFYCNLWVMNIRSLAGPWLLAPAQPGRASSMCPLIACLLMSAMSAMGAPGGSTDSLSLDVEEIGLQHAWPAGPASLRELFKWPAQFLEQARAHPAGRLMEENLRLTYKDGIVVSTDYSGYGSAELAMRHIGAILQADSSEVGEVVCWRASDIMKRRRAMLMAGDVQPTHVFGDLLQRVNQRTRTALLGHHARAAASLRRLIRRGENNDLAANKIGEEMMENMHTLLKQTPFNIDAQSWCYRCQRHCPVHAVGCKATATTIVIAGTTCTSWSSLGKKGKWVAFSAISFMIWAYETYSIEPDIVIHECTPAFQWSVLQRIFEPRYIVMSIKASPTDLGWPCMRPRRWTLLFHRKRRAPILPLTRASFGSLFFRQCSVDGHIFWGDCDQDKFMIEHFAKLAEKRSLPMTTADGHLWPARFLLPQGHLQRLLGYEQLCARMRRKFDYIINLAQNCTFNSMHKIMVPTLLTRTSFLWSMRKSRFLHPFEYMQVMGLPTLCQDVVDVRSGFEVLALDGELDDNDILHACGNGMVQVSVGAMIMFGLGSSRHPGCSDEAATCDDYPLI